jgi:hypothetical protein
LLFNACKARYITIAGKGFDIVGPLGDELINIITIIKLALKLA